MYFPFAKDEAGQKAPYKIEKMKYYLIAGEPSGDLHGANLIRGLQKADPGAEFRFWGGDCMAAAGGAENLRKHYRRPRSSAAATPSTNARSSPCWPAAAGTRSATTCR